jgi:ABC-type uncharacterized transport system auxiliary subunit
MQLKNLVLLATLATILSACAADDEPEPASAERIASEDETEQEAEEVVDAAPDRNTRYDDVYELREAIETAGIDCTHWSIIAEPRNAVERATCTEAIVVSIHSNASEAQRSIDSTTEIMTPFGLDSGNIIGPNWTVNCSSGRTRCEELVEALGGELQWVEGESPQ